MYVERARPEEVVDEELEVLWNDGFELEDLMQSQEQRIEEFWNNKKQIDPYAEDHSPVHF